MRESVLEKRYETEVTHMNHMLQNQLVSPHSYEAKTQELHEWIMKKKEELKRKEKLIKKGWLMIFEEFQTTKRDLNFLMQKDKSQRGKGIHVEDMIMIRSSMSDDENGVQFLKQGLKSDSDMNESDYDTEIEQPKIKVIDTLKVDDNQRNTFLTGYLDDNKSYSSSSSSYKGPGMMKQQTSVMQLQKVPLILTADQKLSLEDPNDQEFNRKQLIMEKKVDEVTRLILGELLCELDNEKMLKTKAIGGPKIFPPLPQIKKEKGIYCTIDSVKDVANGIIDIMIKQSQIYIPKLNVPLGTQPLEKLKILQQNLLNDIEQSSQFDLSVAYLKGAPAEKILDYNDFKEIESRFYQELMKDNNDSEIKKKRVKQMQTQHNKVVFDAFNEALDIVRPWGLKERPLPWKVNINKIKVEFINEKNLQRMLEKTRDKVLEWTSNLCGFIHDKEESLFFIDDEYLTQIREDRMARMLAQEIYEGEELWINYDDEETEVEIEISDIVFDTLILNSIEFYTNLAKKRQQPNYFEVVENSNQGILVNEKVTNQYQIMQAQFQTSFERIYSERNQGDHNELLQISNEEGMDDDFDEDDQAISEEMINNSDKM